MLILKTHRIVCSARMGHGTLEAKFKPLVLLSEVEKLIVVRKDEGPPIDKLSYKILPKMCKNPLLNFIMTPFILVKEVNKQQANLILAYHFQPHFYFAYIASLFTGVPYIIAQTGTEVQSKSDKIFLGSILKHIIKKASYFNVPGKDTYSFWISRGIPTKKLNILHSTIDVDLFKPTNVTKEYDIIFVGRLAEVKRLDKLIKATKNIVESYPNLKVCIVGNGPLEKSLKSLVSQYQLINHFDFVGLQSNIHEWLNKASIFVMTSDSEGLPCAMMEAMSSGLLCLGPNVNNMSDLLEEGKTGYLFDTNDVEELSNKLQYLLQNKDNLNRIREKARDLIIEEHSYEYAKKLWTDELAEIPNK